MCGGFMAACWWVGRRRNFPREMAPFDGAAFRKHLAYASPAVVLPVLIIIFLRFGIATPTRSPCCRRCTPAWCRQRSTGTWGGSD